MLLDTITKLRQGQKVSHGAIFRTMRLLALNILNEGYEDDALSLGIPKLAVVVPPPAILPMSGTNSTIQRHQAAMEADIKRMAEQMFGMLDSNEHDEISVADALEFVRKSGNHTVMPTLESITDRYDKNGNGTIDLSEFVLIVSDM
jgi:hypothetical protein